MIKMPKFIYYIFAIIIVIVCATFCVVSVVNHDTSELVANVTLTITSVVGLIIRSDDDNNKGDNSSDTNKGSD